VNVMEEKLYIVRKWHEDKGEIWPRVASSPEQAISGVIATYHDNKLPPEYFSAQEISNVEGLGKSYKIELLPISDPALTGPLF